jgi:Domain of unknown function (DUF4190)
MGGVSMGWREIMAGHEAIDAEEAERTNGEREAREKVEPRQPLGKANRLAVTALICACCIPFLLVGGILGTVFGMVAIDEIDESNGKERGRGMAQWAIGIGFVNIAISCAAIVLIALALKS